MHLNQVTLPAAQVEECARFYELLGFRRIVDALPRYVRFEAPDGDATLSIELAEGDAPGRSVIYLECEDLDAQVAALQARGVRFDAPPTDEPWLWREARLCDPAGNRLCLYWAGSNRRFPPWRIP